MQRVDALHPFNVVASSQWRECSGLPEGMQDAQAVWLGDQLYVGGGMTSESYRDPASLYMYTPNTDTWSEINDTPVYRFALITYHSQLVLVGGMEYVDEERVWPVTSKLWTLTGHDQWRETLPPMTIKRQCTSAVGFVDNILVAGGVDEKGRSIDIVEVYKFYYWTKVQCLPKPNYVMKSTVLNGHWYLMGGEGQGKEVYYASLDGLVASSEKPLPSVWKRLSDVPHEWSSTAVFGNRLIAVGGYPSSSFIHAYSPYNQSWVHVGGMLVELFSTCTAVHPTGELMVIGGSSSTSWVESCVYKATLDVLYTFDSDSLFTMEALSRLENIGITPLRELEAHKRPFQSVTGMDKVGLPTHAYNSLSLLEMWLQGRASFRPTWRNFFWVLREIKLNHLADQIEVYLSGVDQVDLDVSPESEGTEGREDHMLKQDILISAEEEKHIAALQKAMEEKRMLDHTIVHGVFVGPAGSGYLPLPQRQGVGNELPFNYPAPGPVSFSEAPTGYFSSQQQSRIPQNKSTRLADHHYARLLNQLSVHALKWKEIGTYLGFRPGELDNIYGHSLLRSPIDWLQKMLSQWLQWAPGDNRGSTSFATLENLKVALNQAGLGATAHDLNVNV